MLHTQGTQVTTNQGQSDHLAPNYAPLPVELIEGEGCWLRDRAGREYFDALAGYSALNFGHRHPRLIAAATEQLNRLTLTSRAFEHTLLPTFADRLSALAEAEMIVPMNTGAEAVETAIKAARRWGHRVRGIDAERLTIVGARGNFHGRTTTLISLSTDDGARADFGPFTPGFRLVDFGDIDQLAAALDDTVAAVLLEPIQGEAGVIVPPDGYLTAAANLCRDRGVLLILDEIQSGLGRTGHTWAAQREQVRPDLLAIGKALGGGIMPVSAVAGRADVLGLLTPGSHGSTFGGNPMACALAIAVIDLLETGYYQRRARQLGEVLGAELADLHRDGLIAGFRRAGFWAGLEAAGGISGRQLCEELARFGVLAKDTHGTTIRLSPPLTCSDAELSWMLNRLREALTYMLRR